jgi:signal transduction histidine kinase
MKPLAYELVDASPREMDSGRVRRAFDASTGYGVLLETAVTLPLEAGAAAIVKRMVEVLSSVLPDRAVGVCLLPGDAGASIVELFLPPGVPTPGRDPSRLFPELPDELVVAVGELPGSTLHVASVQGELSDHDERALIRHAALMLASATKSATAIAASRPSEVQTLRAQLIQAEKLSSLGQIVAGVVHELANPITSIVACADALLRRAGTSGAAPEDVEQLKRIGVAADRILKFSRDLTAYARPATELPSPVAVHEVVEQAHAFSEHELSRSGVEFATDFSEGAPPVLGQAGPLTQVFVNLFTNAAHAMSQHGGTLTVRTRYVGEARLLIEVTDTGVGIPEESLAKIFEPFFTTKDAGHGTGLGLSIVREIVEAHGGTVEAESTPGKGTTFFVGLPLRPR